MKTKFLYVFFFGIMASVVLMSRTSGPAFNNLGNRTGSPGSAGTCASGNCHGGGTFTNVATSIAVKSASGNTVTEYVPGQTYTLEYSVAAGGSPVGYGMQSLILNSANTTTGSMLAALTPNTRIVNGSIVEHSNVQANGTFRASWTAPAVGTGTATVYAIGLAVNDNNNDNGDVVSPTAQRSLAENNTSIDYAPIYCTGEAPVLPTINGTQGGVFSTTPGLTINPGTGQITPATSTPGTYVVIYAFGGNEVTDQVEITVPGALEMSFTDSIFCLNASVNPIPTVQGASGGVFSADPAGLVFADAATGEINLANSTEGTYTVSYIVSGGCADTATFALQLTACGSVLQSAAAEQFRLFPNPNNGSFNLQNAAVTGFVAMEWMDATGRLLQRQRVFSTIGETLPLQMNERAPGLYFLRLTYGEQTQVIRVQVQ